jgi:hypothetical protein
VALLPTPLADGGPHRGGDRSDELLLPDVVRNAVRLLPTPTTEPNTGNGHARNLSAEIKANDDLGTRSTSPDYRPTLTDAALYAVGDDRSCLLPTPRAADGGGGAGRHGDDGLDLRTAMDEAVKLFPTPTASSGGRTGQHPDVRRGYGIGASIVEMVDVAVAFGEPEWHQYDAAIQRWSAIFRPAPYPVVAGKGGKPQLCARFEEWMMGWPLNWVNVKGLSRRAQLRICGNGVVPQQAAGALRIMLAELIAELTAA